MDEPEKESTFLTKKTVKIEKSWSGGRWVFVSFLAMENEVASGAGDCSFLFLVVFLSTPSSCGFMGFSG
jgi:hypothetical protein